MFLNGLWFIQQSIRTITSVLPTLAQKNFTKIKFLLENGAHPSEGWGWGTEQPQRLKVNKKLMTFSKLLLTLNNAALHEGGLCK